MYICASQGAWKISSRGGLGLGFQNSNALEVKWSKRWVCVSDEGGGGQRDWMKSSVKTVAKKTNSQTSP